MFTAQKPQSLDMTSNTNNNTNTNTQTEEKGLGSSAFLPTQEPFFLTAKFWKRFSVYISVTLSIVSLIISSIASLKPGNADDMKALTSLDWQSQATADRRFAQMLGQMGRGREGEMERERERERERMGGGKGDGMAKGGGMKGDGRVEGSGK
ncbi:hypothetical protein SBOR_6379 [Sclerotinia borealis F-4128]|uniref:Uncharacterized protein n=1 Tax=Sclerotinia borealis (strain F-4128) TaxID=1432307 RepID=W9CBM6_SCLBF|nr:hypothetical protein SBOR_6379 [Sclerotinia borealis F-4128]